MSESVKYYVKICPTIPGLFLWGDRNANLVSKEREENPISNQKEYNRHKSRDLSVIIRTLVTEIHYRVIL